ncbi:MlaC/ttg2D family ABC transporter substrate-binding protein [Thermaurantiacus sp.]
MLFPRPAALWPAAFLLASLVVRAALPAPLAAEPASPQQQAEAAAFIQKLSGEAFQILRDKALSKEAARARFRDLLRANFAIDQIGARLIRKHRAGLSPAQLSAYRAALPDFIVNTYSDRLYDFASSTVTVVRQIPRGSQGHVDVVTRVSDPAGGKPIDAIWSVMPAPGGRWLVTNLTVNGVNVALTQEADFDSYIQRHGFDALVDFMRAAK